MSAPDEIVLRLSRADAETLRHAMDDIIDEYDAEYCRLFAGDAVDYARNTAKALDAALVAPDPRDDHAGAVEISDEMMSAAAAALIQAAERYNLSLPEATPERWGIVGVILYAALRVAPYPARRMPEPEPTDAQIEAAARALDPDWEDRDEWMRGQMRERAAGILSAAEITAPTGCDAPSGGLDSLIAECEANGWEWRLEGTWRQDGPSSWSRETAASVRLPGWADNPPDMAAEDGWKGRSRQVMEALCSAEAAGADER